MALVLSQTAHCGLFRMPALDCLGCITAWTGGCAQRRATPDHSQPSRRREAHGHFLLTSAHT